MLSSLERLGNSSLPGQHGAVPVIPMGGEERGAITLPWVNHLTWKGHVSLPLTEHRAEQAIESFLSSREVCSSVFPPGREICQVIVS